MHALIPALIACPIILVCSLGVGCVIGGSNWFSPSSSLALFDELDRECRVVLGLAIGITSPNSKWLHTLLDV